MTICYGICLFFCSHFSYCKGLGVVAGTMVVKAATSQIPGQHQQVFLKLISPFYLPEEIEFRYCTRLWLHSDSTSQSQPYSSKLIILRVQDKKLLSDFKHKWCLNLAVLLQIELRLSLKISKLGRWLGWWKYFPCKSYNLSLIPKTHIKAGFWHTSEVQHSRSRVGGRDQRIYRTL